MSELIVVTLTPDQAALFAALDRDEQQAKQTLERVPLQRNGAALATVLAQHPQAAVIGQQLRIDTDAKTITFTPNEPKE